MVYDDESLNATSTSLSFPEVMTDLYFQIAQSIARTEIYHSRLVLLAIITVMKTLTYQKIYQMSTSTDILDR